MESYDELHRRLEHETKRLCFFLVCIFVLPTLLIATLHFFGGSEEAVNRPGFAGGSNFQIGWSRYEQDDEQILP